MAQNSNTLQEIVLIVVEALDRLDVVLTDPASVIDLMDNFGFQIDDLEQSTVEEIRRKVQVLNLLPRLVSNATKLKDTSNLQELIIGLAQLIKEIPTIIEHVNKIATTEWDTLPAPFNSREFADFLPTFPRTLFDSLLATSIQRRSRKAYAMLRLLQVIKEEQFKAPNSSHYRYDHSYDVIDWSTLGTLLTKSQGFGASLYNWNVGSDELDHDEFILNLSRVLGAFGFGARVTLPGPLGNNYYAENREEALWPRQVVVPLYQGRDPNLGLGYVETGFGLLPIPNVKGGKPRGLLLYPYATSDLNKTIPLSESLALTIDARLDSGGWIGFEIFPESIKFVNVDARTSAEGKFLVALESSFAEPFEVFTIPGGSGLFVNGFGISLKGHQEESTRDVAIFITVKDGFLLVNSNEGDGFLQEILPSDPLQIKFDLTIGLSSEKGFFLQGRSDLEYRAYLHKSFGPIFLDFILFRLKSNDEQIRLTLGITGKVELGILTATIENFGIESILDFNSPGSLGLSNLSLGFKFPDGIGCVVKAAGVTGGGFLAYKDNEYSGALQLQFEKLGLAAVGFITTGGREGFSMVISLGVEFSPPIQLSFGFRLHAVGGLIAINRSMSTEAVQAGLINGSLDSLLYPADPINNAHQIVADLRGFLPPKTNRYVFGPALRVTWGPKRLIKADLGLFIELPHTRVLLAGRLSGAFPHEDKALIEIHVDVIGQWSFEKKTLAIDARIFDSHIAGFDLSGDLALRLSWGAKPYFLLALGGFHKDFEVPEVSPRFVEPFRRLRLELGSGKNFTLTCETYLALTSNSFQFGAQVELYYKKGPLRVHGYLGFDTLIIFSPFSFSVEMRAGVSIRFRKRSFASITLSFTLSGTTPWRANGTAKVKVIFFSLGIGFDISWGKSERNTVAAIDPLLPLLDVLSLQESWGNQLPTSTGMAVGLRPLGHSATIQTDTDGSEVQPSALVVHPHGALEVRQSICPLNVRISYFENARVKDHDQFVIASIKVNHRIYVPQAVSEPNANPSLLTFVSAQEFFARCQFVRCSTNERLSAPSFEKMDAGISLESEVVETSPATHHETSLLTYESSVIDEDRTSTRPVRGKPIRAAAQRLVKGNAAARRRGEARGTLRFGDISRVNRTVVRDNSWRIVHRDTLLPAKDDELASYRLRQSGEMTRLEADQVLQKLEEQEPGKSRQFEVIPAFEVMA